MNTTTLFKAALKLVAPTVWNRGVELNIHQLPPCGDGGVELNVHQLPPCGNGGWS